MNAGLSGSGDSSARVVVIGIGNEFRRDDGAGPAVVRAASRLLPETVEVIELDGEPARLMEAWTGADVAYVVDAARAGATPGSVHRFDATCAGLPAWAARGGTHALGVGAAVDLARALDRLPPRLVVYGVEGARFDEGDGLTPEVQAAVGIAAARLVAEVEVAARGATGAGGR